MSTYINGSNEDLVTAYNATNNPSIRCSIISKLIDNNKNWLMIQYQNLEYLAHRLDDRSISTNLILLLAKQPKPKTFKNNGIWLIPSIYILMPKILELYNPTKSKFITFLRYYLDLHLHRMLMNDYSFIKPPSNMRGNYKDAWENINVKSYDNTELENTLYKNND